jgi:hypothetical protein
MLPHNSVTHLLFVTTPGALAYGLLAHLLFQQDELQSLYGLLTLGFICLMPLVLGALVVLLAPRRYRASRTYALLAPMAVALIFLLAAAVLLQELWICLLMAAPFALVLALVGGLLTYLLRRRQSAESGGGQLMLLLLLLSPYWFTPLEQQLPTRTERYRVETAVYIQASPETVWQNVIRVPAIQPAEQRLSFFHLVGVPQPLEAELVSEGVGGGRYGRFARGLLFVETITEWEPERHIRFEIEPQHMSRPTPPLDQIGGTHYDIEAAAYTLEPQPDGRVLLRLSGEYRLTTRFNGYGRLWMDMAMRDFQNYVLQVVKARAEQGQPGAQGVMGHGTS